MDRENMEQTTNYQKKLEKNPLAKFFLDQFDFLLLSEIKKLKPTSLLDVGCGEGFTLDKLMQVHAAKKYAGIEYVDAAIALGKKLHPHVPITKGNIYQLPYKANTFDVVLCSEVLEHLEHPEEALKELQRVTKHYLVLSVPNEPLFTIQRILRGKNILGLGAHPEHIQHWSSNQFKIFVAKQTIIVRIMTPLPWTLVIAEKRK